MTRSGFSSLSRAAALAQAAERSQPVQLGLEARPANVCGALVTRVLTLPVMAVYFDAIRSGTKAEEFRLCTPYWRKRLEGRTYDRIALTKGYPAADDFTRRLYLPWRGYRVTTIQHEHFGPSPVEVFAINVAKENDASN